MKTSRVQALQPAPTPDMTLSACKPTHRWQKGLFDCAPNGLCCMSFCCSCVQLQRNYNRYKYLHDNEHDIDLNPKCGWFCCGSAVTSAWCHYAILSYVRYKIRKARKINKGCLGNACMDVGVTVFCPLCSVHQEAQELDYEFRTMKKKSKGREDV